MDELLRDFLQETGEHVDAVGTQLVHLERDPTDAAMIAAVFRLLHTIKGTCGFLGLGRLGRLAHAAEALLGRMRDGLPATTETVALILAAIDRIRFLLDEIERQQAEPTGSDDDLVAALEHEAEGLAADADAPQAASPVHLTTLADAEPRGETGSREVDGKGATIRVAVDALESMMTLVSELVLTRNQLADVARRTGQADVAAALGRLSSVVADLQDQVMRTRMQPLDRIFATLPRLVRDLGRDLRKDIVLTVEGGDTELDRQLLDVVRDPLVHLIRNCADHGLENAAERRAYGKTPDGTIRIAASHVAGQILIEVSDDGRGLDLPRIGATAIRRGLVDEAGLSTMSVDELARLIFAPGFSTASTVTAVSGRGVGLDVVRANIEAIGGDVSISTSAGEGTCFTLRIPLTLAIASALIVAAAGHRFALPQTDVVEIVPVGGDSPHRLETVQGCAVLSLRGGTVPVLDLAGLLRLRSEPSDEGERVIAIARFGEATFGLLLDAVDDVQEIVVKPVGTLLAGLRLYAGHTILGDGSVVLILDLLGLAATLGLRRTNVAPSAARADAASRSAGTRILTFRAGSPGLKALPLSMIKRIETVEGPEIERSAGRLVVQREDGLLSLVPLVEGAPVRAGAQPVLIIESSGHTFGLLIDEIVDIVEAPLDIAVPTGTEGALGTSSVGGRVTEFVDSTHFHRQSASGETPERRRVLEAVS